MSASPDDVLGLLVFARVVEAKSFTAAAAKLGLSKSVVSARIAQLEARLGTRLLQRTTRRLSLTGDGLALYAHAASVAQAADQATAVAAAAPSAPRGVLRVSAAVSFAEHHLLQPLAAYMARYPDVHVELQLSDRLIDLVEEGVDVAVRLSSRLDDSSLVGRVLAHDRTLVCASPEYLGRRGIPAHPADLLHHDCIRYTLLKPEDEWRFRAGGKSFAVPIHGRFAAASGSVIRQAVLAGVGLAVLPSFMVWQDLAAGRLQQVLGPFSFVRLSVHAVYPAGRVVPANVRALLELLVAHFRAPVWAGAARRA